MDEDDLLPEDRFRLYAVLVRFPRQLDRALSMELVSEGVYQIRHFGGGYIRVIIINQLPLVEHNAMLQVFGTRRESLAYAVQHYRIRSAETSTLLYKLFQRYQEEVETMPDALEEFTRETIEEILRELPIKKRLEGLTLEQRLEGLTPEERAALLRLLKSNGESAGQ
jgi:hypothetical protein